MKIRIPLCVVLILNLSAGFASASEVIENAPARVLVREHPKTGKPYISIVSKEAADTDPLQSLKTEKLARPDYRMLDPKMKSGQIPYEGPVSDRKKVYILAGTLAAGGVIGGTLIAAVAPAAAAAGSGAGAGAYAAGGAAVAAGTVSASVLSTRPDPDKDRMERIAKSKEIFGN